MTQPRGWGLPESHLLPDAVVALVDGELSLGAQDRASSHIARCPLCANEVAAQRQAVAAVRRATDPPMSAGFLASLRSIPQNTELGSTPDNLAITADGQLVAVQRPDRVAGLRDAGVLGGSAPLGSSTALGSSTPLGSSTTLGGSAALGSSAHVFGGGRMGLARRRAAQGAGVVVSGLVLSALALVGTAGDTGQVATNTGPQAPPRVNLLPADIAVPQQVTKPAAPSPSSSTTPVPVGLGLH